MALDVTHDINKQRFCVGMHGQIAELKYKKVADDTLEYYSTFVPNELRGRGIAGVLTKYALDYAQQHGLKVIPSCSFVKRYIEAHDHYSSLITTKT